jgi:hypothetical protein
MATVNFSVPDDVKRAFNEEFKGENRSAIIAGLMKRAVAERRREARRAAAIERLLALRREQTGVSTADVEAARDEGRP